MRFRDKVAIVTGAAGGIGLATAERLGSEGARVVIADLKAEAAANSAESVRQAGAPDAIGLACDVASEAQVAATVKTAMDRFGRLDVVVNNAGLMTSKLLRTSPQRTGRRSSTLISSGRCTSPSKHS